MGKWKDCRFGVRVLTLISMLFRVYNLAKFWWKELEDGSELT